MCALYIHTFCVCVLHFVPTVPVVTISPPTKEVNAGETFTLTCTSSISGLVFDWRHPNRFSESPNVEFSEPLGESITVFNATVFNEGNYTCSIREFGELIVASATATVDFISST